MLQILEDYEVDGLYNDWGYVPNAEKRIKELAPDEMAAFEETPQYDGAVTDLLYLIYSEIKRRGGIYKMHADCSNQPQTAGLKVYDYLWVGEGVKGVTACGKPSRTTCLTWCLASTGQWPRSRGKRTLPAIHSLHAVSAAAGRPAADRGTSRDSHPAAAGSE